MDRFINFDPYTIGEHGWRMHAEINSLRLEERLRKNREGVADGSGRFWCADRRPDVATASPENAC